MGIPVPAPERSSEESRNDFDDTSFCWVCKQAPPCPRFVAVPGRFWELHGSMLQSDELQLQGPNKAIYMVKVKRTYDEVEKKLSVLVDSGWDAFRVANNFRVGDVLEFFLVGRSYFTVDLVERIEQLY